MPEIVIPPAPNIAPNTLVGGDCYYEPDLELSWGEAFCRFGRESSKVGNYGAITHFDASGIDLGDIVLDSTKFEVVGDANDGVPFTVDIDVLALNTRLNAVDTVDHEGQWSFAAYSGLFPTVNMWLGNHAAAGNITIFRKGNTGIGDMGQVWTSLGGLCKVYSWYAMRTGTVPGMTWRTDTYKAVGSAGAWTRGDLVDTGIEINAVGINQGAVAGVLNNPTVQFSTNPNDVFISYFVTIGGSAGRVGVSFSNQAAGYENENAVIQAVSGRKISSFQERCQWTTGEQIKGAAKQGITDSVTAKTFVAGTLHGFGNPFTDDETYSPEAGGGVNFTELTNFKANLQAALRARTSLDQWIGIRLQDFSGTVDNGERYFRSVNNATETLPGIKGMALTINYTPAPTPPPVVPPGVPFWDRVAKRAGRSVTRVLGEATIYTAAGQPGVFIRKAVFDEAYAFTGIVDGADVESRGPAVTIFNDDIALVNFAQGDAIRVRGRNFIVKQVKPDSQNETIVFILDKN